MWHQHCCQSLRIGTHSQSVRRTAIRSMSSLSPTCTASAKHVCCICLHLIMAQPQAKHDKDTGPPDSSRESPRSARSCMRVGVEVTLSYHENVQIQKHIDPSVVRTFATKCLFSLKLSFSRSPEMLDFRFCVIGDRSGLF